MKLDLEKFKTDEDYSNPMVVAQRYPDCPLHKICFGVVMGFGTIVGECEYLRYENDNDNVWCVYKME